MKPYHDLLQKLLDQGKQRGDRTGTGTLGLFGETLRFDLQGGFPLLTTKKVHFKSVMHELLWFVSGSTNIQPLVRAGVGIWTDWPLKKFNEYLASVGLEPMSQQEFEDSVGDDDDFAQLWGDLGPIYSKQWRAFTVNHEWVGGPVLDTADQLAKVIQEIKANPDSRRLLVVAWNPAEVDACALPPCHYAFQFHVQDGRLSCMFHMRSHMSAFAA